MEPLVNAVYFDTSILRQQPFHEFGRALKPLLEDARQRYPFDSWVPELAVREWAEQLGSLLDERVSGVIKAARELGKYDSKFRFDYTPPWGKDSRGHARATLEKQLQNANVAIAPTPTIDLDRLVDLSISRTPPFDNSGRGFRDAIILETIGQHARGRYDSVVLLSADKDFADSALQAATKTSGVLIRRARDAEHAIELINEKFFASLSSMIRAAQEEVLPWLRHHREEILSSVRRTLRPSEELLRGKTPTDGTDFFWSLHRIDRVLGYRFGDFESGRAFPPLLGLLDGASDRTVVEMLVEVEFDLLVSLPTNLDKPRYALPDSGESAMIATELAWMSREMPVTRKVPLVVSFTRDEEGNLEELRLEQCDGRTVEAAA